VRGRILRTHRSRVNVLKLLFALHQNHTGAVPVRAEVPKEKQFAQFAVDKVLPKANHNGPGRKFLLREKFPEGEGSVRRNGKVALLTSRGYRRYSGIKGAKLAGKMPREQSL
jgi:hypothetical protein